MWMLRMLDDLVLRDELPSRKFVQLTLSIQKTWACDYRECDETAEAIAVGQRGQHPYLGAELPQHSKWCKIAFTGSGKTETLHFCCQDHSEKELNLLTQQGIEPPTPAPLLGSGK